MTNEQIIEELFCVKLENKALADIYFRNEAERWVYSYMFSVTEDEHLERYKYVTKYTKNKKVLDIACGSGYGSYIILKEGEANEVIGMDLNSDSIRYGNHRFKDDQIKRIVCDAQEVIEPENYDIIVSFETIEHLPKFERFLNHMSQSLSKNGYFFVSTPIVNKTSTICKNPFHVIEWSFADFQVLINKYFNIEEVFVQNVHFKSQIKKKTLLGKLKNKIFRPKKIAPIKFEKYSTSINIDDISEGYQMLVCSKKK